MVLRLPDTHQLARDFLITYALLLLLASLYPWLDWNLSSTLDWTFLWAPFPRYWTWSELLANIVVYIPLGSLLFLTLRKQFTHLESFVIAALMGFSLSLLVETWQLVIPSRISSNVDILMNTLGILVGALFAVVIDYWLQRFASTVSKCLQLFAPRSSKIIVLLCLWLAAQLSVDAYLFATGGLFSLFSDQWWLGVYKLWSPTPLQRMMFEAVISFCALFVTIGLIFLITNRPRVQIIFAYSLLVSAILFKVSVSPWVYANYSVSSWVSVGGIVGFMVAAFITPFLRHISTPYLRYLLIVVMIIQWVLINLVPRSFYLERADLNTGWLYVEPISAVIAMIWPLLLLVYLIYNLILTQKSRSRCA